MENATMNQLASDWYCHKGMEIPVDWRKKRICKALDFSHLNVQFKPQEKLASKHTIIL